MKIGGYALEEIGKRLEEDRTQGIAELKRMLKRYADDTEAKELARKLEKGDRKALEELKELAHMRKLEDSGASGSLPTGDYRRSEKTEQTR